MLIFQVLVHFFSIICLFYPQLLLLVKPCNAFKMFFIIYFYWIVKDFLSIPQILSLYWRKKKSLPIFLALTIETSPLLPCVLAGSNYFMQFAMWTHHILSRNYLLPLVYLIDFCQYAVSLCIWNIPRIELWISH